MKKKMSRDFTAGSIPKQLARFMLPFMASNVFQVMYSMVDMIIVGKYVGDLGLSAVSVGSMVLMAATTLVMGFSNGGQIMLAQLLGAGRRERISGVIGTMFCLLLGVGVLLSALMLALHSPLADALNVPPECRDMMISYMLICAAGFVFVAGYNAVTAVMRAMGDSKHPFIFICVATVVNIALDLVFIGPMNMGVVGAALATIIGQAASFISAAVFAYCHREQFNFDFKLRSFRVLPNELKAMVKLGTPMAIQACVINFSMMAVNSFVNLVGVGASATYGVGMKIDDIINKMTLGIQHAAAPMIGQNIGAAKHERVKRVVYWTWAMVAACSAVCVFIYVKFGLRLFAVFDDDPATFALAPTFISAVLWCFPAVCVMRGSNAFLQGSGNTVMIMFLSFVDSGLRLGFSYLLGIVFDMGFYGFVLGWALAPYGVGIPGALYFFFGKWKNKKSYAERA